MSQTYRDLTSSDEPDIFAINNDQKHILNQLIHFALKNWEACLTWCYKYRCSAIEKNSLIGFSPTSWKKLKPPAYSIDYVQDIHNKTTSKTKADASCTAQKNNWLHPGTDLFSKHHDKSIGFFSGHKIIPYISTIPTHLNHWSHLPTLLFIYNYSILPTNSITLSKVTPCSIVACKSIGNAPTTT